MGRFRVAFILIFFPFLSFGQLCNCGQEFEFMRHEVENNYAGFKDKVNNTNRKNYERLTKEYLSKTKSCTKDAYCLAFIKEWLDFFNDGHLQLTGSRDINAKDTAAINDLARHAEVISLSHEKLKELSRPGNGMEGIYVKRDSVYTIAIVKSKNEYRDYAGVVLTSKNSMWTPGQVILEIKMKRSDTCNLVAYRRNHTYAIVNGVVLNGEWNKVGAKPRPQTIDVTRLEPVQFRKLTGKILYLQIGSFGDWNAKAIDSVLAANEPALKSTPNLILDLRENGGGADFAFHGLLRYCYTNPVISIGNDVLATQDNIDRWKLMLDNPDIPEDSKSSIRALIGKMEANVGKLVLHSFDDTIQLDKVEQYPQQIVVLIDRHCASSTEQFLLYAMQSSKVTIMGQPTKGVLDYSNMKEAISPSKKMSIKYATTRSRRIDKGQGIDNIGIKPRFELAEDKDWITEARNWLEKK